MVDDISESAAVPRQSDKSVENSAGKEQSNIKPIEEAPVITSRPVAYNDILVSN